ncbi:hypothetical protein AB0A63_00940 [Lentzea sp. NPDC042327]|uniref:hypothetical protein n=1 Tax=Lentzea sp. NPDC042327 TaxID=3154801 RepID=UPI0033DDAD3D
MSPYDWQEIIGVVGVFVLITAVTTVLIWQLAATWRAKAALARENEYRALAERAVQAQESSERKLDELQERMRSVERILKEVE